MFCSNCGKQLEDGVRFCKYCGAPTSHSETPGQEPAGIPGIKQEDSSVPEQPTAITKSTKLKAQKGGILLGALIAVIVIVAGVFLVRSMSGSGNDSAAGQSYAIPELPDTLIIEALRDQSVQTYDRLLMDGRDAFPIPENHWNIQLAEDGLVAMSSHNGGDRVLIYRGGTQIGEIPRPVEYFFLSGSGKKIVYGTTGENSYLWDVSSSESTLVSDKYRSWGISYDGSTLDMGEYYSKNGQEPIWAGSNVTGISPDGKYIYCTKLRYTAVSDDVNKYYPSVSVLINGTAHVIFENESGFEDKDGWWYWPRFIACSEDYKEVLFSVYDDIYYYSVDDGEEVQHVENIKDEHLGQLLPLSCAGTYASIYTQNNYSDAISAWRSGSYDRGSMPYRTQKSLQNSLFCLLKDQNGVKSCSIVRFVDNTFIELIPNITGNICFSADETKLWCVADGRLAFCDLKTESPYVIYCDTAYVRAYDGSGVVGKSGDMQYGEYTGYYAMYTAPIAVTSDGETAYFIDIDGSLWMCTPDTIQNPQFIADRAFWVQCSADNMVYLMRGDSYEYFQGRACDLYLIDADGEIEYKYSNVIDMYMTKHDIYISVGSGEAIDPTSISGALYCISDGGYQLICDNFSAGDIYPYWWGA